MTSYETIHDRPDRWRDKPCPVCKVAAYAACVDDAGIAIPEGAHYQRLVVIAGGDIDTNDGRDERELERRGRHG